MNIKAEIAAALLEEVRADIHNWYYVSVADDVFRGGYVVKARGQTEAWLLVHALGWYEDGCSTETVGPIPGDALTRIPEEKRWRRLSEPEAMTLGD